MTFFTPKNMLIGTFVFMAAIIALTNIFSESISNYSLEPSGFNYTVYDKFSETKDIADDITEKFENQGQVTVLDSIVSFINTGLSISRLAMLNIPIVGSILTTFGGVIGIDPIWIIVGLLILSILFIFAVITAFTGRQQ